MSHSTLVFSHSFGKPYAVTIEPNGKKPLVRLKEQPQARMFDPTTNLRVLLATTDPLTVSQPVAMVMLGESVLCTVYLAVGGSWTYEFSDLARLGCPVVPDSRVNLIEAQVCALVTEAILARDNQKPTDFAGTIPLASGSNLAEVVGNKSLTA